MAGRRCTRLEEVEGHSFLVLELAEGEELAQRLSRGAIPLDDSIEIAIQIAAALEAAHERGVVHRDLKPGNVMLAPDGGVKVLDFGLARAWSGEPEAGANADADLSPTLTLQATRAGVILGTAGYMAPEQARGKRVDQRADLWAFGVVLWEMLTGCRLFSGQTVSDVMAAVLTRELDWGELPAATPPSVRRLLRRCLERDPRRRLHSAADAALDLEEAGVAFVGEPASVGTTASRPSRRPSWALVAGALMVGALLAFYLERLGHERPVTIQARPAEVRFAIPTPADVMSLTISGDGRRVAYQVENARAPLFLRDLASFETREIAGTEGARSPFLSPDGHWLAFYKDGKLRKLSLEGGDPTTICDAPADSPGAAWGPGGTILFSPTWAHSGLWRVSAEGRRAEAADPARPGGPRELPLLAGLPPGRWSGGVHHLRRERPRGLEGGRGRSRHRRPPCAVRGGAPPLPRFGAPALLP